MEHLAYRSEVRAMRGPRAAGTRGKWRLAGGGGVWRAGDGTPEAVSPDIVNTLLPEQILQEDEIVLVLTKPSLVFIVYSSFVFVLATLLMGVTAAQFSRMGTGLGAYFPPATVALVTVLVIVGRLVWALLVWTSHVYMLTNLRIVTIKGVVNVHMFQAPLRKIQKTDLFEPVVQRVLGTGTIGFSTAAAAGNLDSTWIMIAHPAETHEKVVAAIHRAQSK